MKSYKVKQLYPVEMNKGAILVKQVDEQCIIKALGLPTNTWVIGLKELSHSRYQFDVQVSGSGGLSFLLTPIKQ